MGDEDLEEIIATSIVGPLNPMYVFGRLLSCADLNERCF